MGDAFRIAPDDLPPAVCRLLGFPRTTEEVRDRVSATIDELIERMLRADTREEMVTVAHVLDRVMRLGHYWVPQWYNDVHNTAYWDVFGVPETMPRYEFRVAETWWAKDA